jgi:hypothetical protein
MDSHPLKQTDLISIVAQHVNRRDWTSCLRICKAFFAIFIKKVWFGVTINNQSRLCQSFDAEVFGRHKELIRHLYIGECGSAYFSLEPNATITGLQNDTITTIQNSVLALLSSPDCSFQSIYILDATLPTNWLQALLLCKNFESLLLSGVGRGDERLENHFMRVSAGNEDSFWKICHRPRKLTLADIHLEKWPTVRAYNRECLSSVYHLDIGRMRIAENDWAEHLIAGDFHNLRLLNHSVHWRHGSHPRDFRVRENFNIFLEGIKKIRYLNTLRERSVYLDDGMIACILENAPKLRNLELYHGHIGPCFVRALVAEHKDDESWRWSDSIPRTLRKRLCDTLERLCIEHLSSGTNWFSLVMENCPMLHTLETMDVEASQILSGKQWVCTNLRRFAIRIVLDIDPEKDPGSIQLFATLSKIGQLKRLTWLGVAGADGLQIRYEMTNERPAVATSLKALGCLPLLRTLVLTSSLDTFTTTHNDLPECLEHWPKLEGLYWHSVALPPLVRPASLPDGWVESRRSAVNVLKAKNIGFLLPNEHGSFH